MFGIKLPSYIYIYTHRPFLGLILLVAGWTPFCCTSIMQISTTSQRCSIHGLRSGDFGGHIVCVGVCEGGMGFRWEACNLWSRAIAFLCALFYRYHVQQGGDGIESGGHNNSFGGGIARECSPLAPALYTMQDVSSLSDSNSDLPSKSGSRYQDSSHQATFSQSSIVQLCWACKLQHQFPVLSWQERHLVWSSAAISASREGSDGGRFLLPPPALAQCCDIYIYIIMKRKNK